MFRLETTLSGVSITPLGVDEHTKGRICTLMYAAYTRERPIPSAASPYANNLTLWTNPFVTRNIGLSQISLWEPGVLYRLPQVALDALDEGDDLCAAPVRIEIRHRPYSGFAVDAFNRGSADGETAGVTTALHIGAHTPCVVAPRDTLVSWLSRIDRKPILSPFRYDTWSIMPWVEPLVYEGDVRVEHLSCLLDRPVELIGEEVSRETA